MINNGALLAAIFIWVSFIVFTHSLRKKDDFSKKLRYFTLGYLSLLCLFGAFTFINYNFEYIFIALVLGYLALAAKYCFKLNESAALYVSIWSLISTQFIYQLWILKKIYIEYKMFEWFDLPLGLLLWFILIFFIIWNTIAKTMPSNGEYHIGPRQLISAIILFIMFELFYTSMVNSELTVSEPLLIPGLLAQVYGLITLYFQTELFKKSIIEQELKTMNLLWENQKIQYNLRKENIELINQKCHDIKHQIAAVKTIAKSENIDKYLNEIGSAALIYDSLVQTGNEVLDTILSEKSLYCEANGIHINNVVDGKKLDFIDPIDLYTILGNAIDNAIDCVKKIENPDLRLIDIAIYSKEQFLVMTITNPITEFIEFENGIPVSSKPVNGYHGYGVKSIKHYVEKYDGNISISVQNNCFILKMLLPIRK